METKKTYRYFSIFEYEKEQDYLREMHRSGWKFLKVSGFCAYYFEKSIPEDMIYQIDYNKEGIEHKEEYIKMFADCGWEYLQDYVGYSFFRKSASETNNKEGIFCDDDSRLQMLERVCRGRIIPLIVQLPCIFILQFINGIIDGKFIYTMLFGALLCLYAWLLALFVFQYRKSKGRKQHIRRTTFQAPQ